MRLDEKYIDALKEITNIGVGRAAGILNSMLSTHIELSVPSVEGYSVDEVDAALVRLGTNPISMVELGFHGDFGGSASLLFPIESSRKLIKVLTGEDFSVSSMNPMHLETLNEIGNIVLNGVMGSFANVLSSSLRYDLPNYSERTAVGLSDKIKLNAQVFVLFIDTTFSAEELHIDGRVLILFEVSSFEALLKTLEDLM
jgi:chemotaxis protein CheC